MLVARYNLTDPLGSAYASDSSGNNYTGSYSGTPVQDMCGTDFGGGFDQFLSATYPALAPSSVGGISCWLRWSSSAGSSVRDWSGIPNGDNGWLIATAYSGSTYTGQIDYRVGGTIVSTGLNPSFLIDFDRCWVLTWDTTESRLYLDGSILHVGPPPGPTPIALPWTIGKNGELNEWYSTHALDFRVYNHKLSAGEAAAIYDAGQPCSPVPGSGSLAPLRQRQNLVNKPRMRQAVR